MLRNTLNAAGLLLVLGVAVAAVILLGGCRADQGTASDTTLLDETVATPTTEVSIFYPSADVIAEERVSVQETDELPLVAVRELFKATPRDPDIKVTLPKAEVRSVTVKGDVAWVDFDRAVIVTGESKETQRAALASVIYTLKQFEGIERVGFTVEGKKSGEIDGKDVREFWGDVTLDQAPWGLSAAQLN